MGGAALSPEDASRPGPVRVPGVDRLPDGFARKVLHGGGAEEPPREIVLCRTGGRLYALDSLCPHEGGRIAEGPLMEDRFVFCPLHLYRFDPRDGAAVDVDCPPATVYPVEEHDGVAEVWVDGL